MVDRFDAIFACAVAMSKGRVLQIREVTAGNGTVTDWRYERNGNTLLQDADVYDVAVLFVDIVGYSAALEAATLSED